MFYQYQRPLPQKPHVIHYSGDEFATPGGYELQKQLCNSYGSEGTPSLEEIVELVATGVVVPNANNLYGFNRRLNSTSITDSRQRESLTVRYEEHIAAERKVRAPNSYEESCAFNNGRIYLPRLTLDESTPWW